MRREGNSVTGCYTWERNRLLGTGSNEADILFLDDDWLAGMAADLRADEDPVE
jgi:hypothetical protein